MKIIRGSPPVLRGDQLLRQWIVQILINRQYLQFVDTRKQVNTMAELTEIYRRRGGEDFVDYKKRVLVIKITLFNAHHIIVFALGVYALYKSRKDIICQ